MSGLLPKLAFGDEIASEVRDEASLGRFLWGADGSDGAECFFASHLKMARCAEVRVGGIRVLASASSAVREVITASKSVVLLIPVNGQLDFSLQSGEATLIGGKGAAFLSGGSWTLNSGLNSSIRIVVPCDLWTGIYGTVSSLHTCEVQGDRVSMIIPEIEPALVDSLIALLRNVVFLSFRQEFIKSLDLQGFLGRLVLAVWQQGSVDDQTGSAKDVRSTKHNIEDRLQLIVDAVVADLSTPLSLPDMEVISGLSKRSIQYLFKERYGCSPITWQLRERLSGAYAALRSAHDTRSITQIAYDFGFSSSSTFSLYFKRQFGFAPSRVR